MKELSIKYFIESDDPLSDEACSYLVDYNEEDLNVDFKVEFKQDVDKSWIDLAVDVTSFSNTNGGYLVFGIRDRTYEKIGISKKSYDALLDIKKVLEKIDRNVQPKFTEVRTKGKEIDGNLYAFLYAPLNKNKTHVFEQELYIEPKAGRRITIVKQGAIYIRKSGSNQILTSAGIDELINKRIERFKDKIMDGLTRVVSAEIDQEVVIINPEDADDGTKTFTVTDSPEGINIKGTKLIIKPETIEDKVNAWVAVNKSDVKNFPTIESIMRVYSERENIVLTNEQYEYMAYFSMVLGVASFYWLGKLSNKTSTKVIEKAFENANNIEKIRVVNISAFYGVTLYEKLKARFGNDAELRGIKKLEETYKRFNTNSMKGDKHANEKATQLSLNLSLRRSIQITHELLRFDCGLYAKF